MPKVIDLPTSTSMTDSDYLIMESSGGGTKKITRNNALTPVKITQGGTGATSRTGARDALGFHSVAFDANTAKTITIPNNYRGILILASAYTVCVGMYRVQANNSGTVTAPYAMFDASGVSFSVGTNALTVTTTYTTAAMFLDISGSLGIS